MMKRTVSLLLTASEEPVWGCATIYHDGAGQVESITFEGDTAVFEGGTAQIGIWWADSWYANWIAWLSKSDYPDYSDVLAYLETAEINCGEFPVVEEQEWGWNVYTK